jgi:nitrous oxide reductase accessory protein NosL
MKRYVRVFVGLILVAFLVGALGACQRQQADLCAMCSKQIPERTAVTLVSAAGDTFRTCCAHCALLLTSRSGDEGTSFERMTTEGYETGEMVDLRDAYFVYGSNVVPCCVPSVIVFLTEERARDFAAREGGQVLAWNGARATFALEAGDRCEMCSKSLDFEAARPSVLLLAGGGDRVACCPHCAFMLETMLAGRTEERVEEMWMTAPGGELFRVDEGARFVADSDAPICCQPMVVPCPSEEAAGAFVTEHGGRILTEEETRALMSEHGHRARARE